jgi:hypothetical protein
MHNAGLSFQEFQELEKRKKEILVKFQARAAVHTKKQKQQAKNKEMLKKFIVDENKNLN